MSTNIHYTVAAMQNSKLLNGMYSRGDKYANEQLARQYARLPQRGDADAVALVEVETAPGENGDRRLVREVVLDVNANPGAVGMA